MCEMRCKQNKKQQCEIHKRKQDENETKICGVFDVVLLQITRKIIINQRKIIAQIWVRQQHFEKHFGVTIFCEN